MSMFVNINGVQRKIIGSYADVNGVMRENTVMVNDKGVWRSQFKQKLEESDILGFRMVYVLDESSTHPDYPHLVTNRKIPANISITGDHPGYMDLTEKGIVFRYMRQHPEGDNPPSKDWQDNGLLRYEGHLYAVLVDDTIIDIPVSTTPAAKTNDVSVPSHTTTMFDNLRVTIEAWVTYESYGYYMQGWNNLFYSDAFLDPTKYEDREVHKNLKRLNSYVILPIWEREDAFDPIASIGIARDTNIDDFTDMVGSYGALKHTIFNIMVNNVSKPFVIECYN